MKQPSTLVKVAAVASSLVLGAGFVGCHAGAFDWLKPSELAGTSGNTSPGSTQPAAGTQPAPVMFSGTKSASPSRLVVGTTPTGTFTPDPDIRLSDSTTPFSPSAITPNKSPTIMFGPKSAPVFVNPLPKWAVPNAPSAEPPSTSPPLQPEK